MRETILVVAWARELGIEFEGIYLEPYLCPGKKPTIGIGATFYQNGRRVTLFDPKMHINDVYSLHTWHVTSYFLPRVQRLCPGLRTPGQHAAIVDFCFNLGEANLAASTLRKVINSGDHDRVPEQLRRWKYAGGVVQRGLVRRREANIAYWNKHDARIEANVDIYNR